MKKLIVNSNALKLALQNVSKVMVNRPVLDIIENFLFEVQPNGLTVTATDLEIFSSQYFNCEADENFSFCFPKEILKVLEKTDLQPVVICFDESTNQITVLFEGDTFKFSGTPSDDYPIKPLTNKNWDLVASANLEILKQHKEFRGKDELRMNLTGTYFEIDKQITITSTDANLLRTDLIQSITNYKTHNFILSSKACNLMITGPVAISCDGIFTRFVNDNQTLICKNIDEKYPNFRQVIPEKLGISCTFDTKELNKKLDKALIVANKSTNQVRFSINSELQLSSFDFDLSTEFETSITCEHTGPNVEIGFNAKLMQTVLKYCPEKSTLLIDTPTKPAIIKNENSTLLIMPMMLSNH